MRTVALLALVVACGSSDRGTEKTPNPPADEPKRTDPYERERTAMVDIIATRGVSDERVLEAMRGVLRHELVPANVRDQAYADRPLPIGFDKTISQPFIVAMMTAAVKLRAGDRVLEIGTGSGYQAAVLAEMSSEVYTIEIVDGLAKRAERDLERIGYRDVHVRSGDGRLGWPDAAPFDAIIVTAATNELPNSLLDQLATGGRIVIPIGDDNEQMLSVVEKRSDGTRVDQLMPVRFGRLMSDGDPF